MKELEELGHCVPSMAEIASSVTQWYNDGFVRGRSGFDTPSSHSKDLKNVTCYFPA